MINIILARFPLSSEALGQGGGGGGYFMNFWVRMCH